MVNGRMRRGESILIHSGSGGVGLAAIHVALFYGCEVFTTVGTPEKREYIKELFPQVLTIAKDCVKPITSRTLRVLISINFLQIKDSHIGNSRDTSFEQMIKLETKGRGVDLILNSLAEEKLQASLRCLAEDGRFLEIGKFDLANNNPLGMEVFLNRTSFHGVQLDAIFYASDTRKQEFKKLVCDALASGAVKPLKATVFDFTEVEQAFRYMAAGKHMGKVLLKLRDEETDKVVVPVPRNFETEPRFFCHEDKSYIIIGMYISDWG